MLAADILEIDVYAFGRRGLECRAKLAFLVVDGSIQAELLFQPHAFLLGARAADHVATFDLGNLRRDAADRAGGG